MTEQFKIGDTIKIVSRLYENDGTGIDISSKTIRSVLKNQLLEIVGVTQLLDNFTLMTVFSTASITEATKGKFQTDIRFTENGESFSTPTNVIEITTRVS